ncbi:hypothetical protein CsSME_00003028 [Camellia sinensis var. sinensis]
MREREIEWLHDDDVGSMERERGMSKKLVLLIVTHYPSCM